MPFNVLLCSAPTNSQCVGRHAEPVDFCISPFVGTKTAPKSPEAAAKCNRPNFVEHRRFTASRRSVTQEQKVKKDAFVNECQVLCTMLGTPREAQYIATRMALEAVYRYRKEQRQLRVKLMQQKTEARAWNYWREQRRMTKEFLSEKDKQRTDGGHSCGEDASNLSLDEDHKSGGGQRWFNEEAEAARRAQEEKEDQLLRAILEDVSKLMFSPAWAANPNPVVKEHPYLYTMSEIQKQRLFMDAAISIEQTTTL